MFLIWDATHRLAYLLDEFIGRFKGSASRLINNSTEEKDVRQGKVR
jgi:hypothetical protein